MGSAVITRKRRSSLFRRQAIDGWVFASGVVGGTIIFNIIPMLFSFLTGFTEWDGVHIPQFNGISNYIDMFHDKFFWSSLSNTIYFTLANIPFSVVTGLLLAILINRQLPLVNWFRAAFFSPVVTSTVAIAIVWRWIFAPYYGIFNMILGWFGIQGPEWLNDTRWAMLAVIIVTIWQSSGYNMILYLAGLQGISKTLYEAAKIDGAGEWQQFLYITVPLISPTTFFILIMSFISSFQVFGLIYVMTNGGPAYSTMVYIYYLFQNAFNFFKMGYASSLAWVLFLIIGLVTLIQWKLQSRWVFYR